MPLNTFANRTSSLPLSELDANFTFVSDSTNLSFLQSGTGAVSRTVQAKERDIVSVKDFGAVGDGTTNDYTAIQAAVTYALTQYGCAVYFPTGRYLVNSTVSIAGGIFLKGNGSYIINGQTNAAAIQFGDGVTRYYGGGIDGLYFTGKSGVVGVNGQYGLLVSKMGQMKFDNMRADASLSALYRPFYFSDVSQFVVNDIEAQGATLHGVSFINCTDGRINSGRSDANTGDGWSLNTNQGMIFTSCSAYNNTRYGWDLESTTPASAVNKNNWFVSCVGDTSGQYNWVITDCKDTIFVGCWGSTQQSDAANTSSTGFYLSTAYCDNVQFVGGGAYYNNSHGVQLVNSVNNIRFDNFAFGSQTNGNGRSGTGYGLQIGGGANDKVRVIGGYFGANTTGTYRNDSSGTDIIVSACVGANDYGRTTNAQGASVAAANNLVLSYGGNYVPISGATQINLIDNSGWQGGSVVTLKFASTPTVKHNTAASGNNKPILLAGAVDFVASANDTLTLRYDSTDAAWYEQARAVI